MSNIDSDTANELFEIFTTLQEQYNNLSHIMRRIGGQEYSRATAYWLANIECGIRAEEYFSGNATFKSFLVDSKIIDEDENFIFPDREE